ncbi:MAG: hypothetical protein AAGB93_13180 [Planctomycetota bacterium]
MRLTRNEIGSSNGSVNFIHLEEAGSMLMPRSGATVPILTNEHSVVFAGADEWDVTTSTTSGTPVTGIEVWRTADNWTGSRYLDPRAIGTRIHVATKQPTVRLAPAAGHVYWFGGGGYAWSEFRWSQRFELGHDIILHQAASVIFQADSADAAGITLSSRQQSGIGAGAESGSWTLDDYGRFELEGLRAGSYTFLARSPHGELAWSDEVRLAEGESRIVQVDLAQDLGSVTLRLDGSLGTHPWEVPTASRLSAVLGLGTPIECTELMTGEDELVASWESVPEGPTVLQAAGRCFEIDVRANDHVELHESIAVDQYFQFVFVDVSTGEPEPVNIMSWSLLRENHTLPPRLLPPTCGSRLSMGPTWEVPLEPGELVLVLQSKYGFDVQRIAVRDPEQLYEVLVSPRYSVTLASKQPVANAYFDHVTLFRGKEPVAMEEISYGLSAVDGAHSLSVKLSIGGQRPDAIHLPARGPEFPSGRIDLPPTTVGWELDLETLDVRLVDSLVTTTWR